MSCLILKGPDNITYDISAAKPAPRVGFLAIELSGTKSDKLGICQQGVILEGIRDPATPEIGFMPAFRDGLDDRQTARLAAYMRVRFAPDKPAWTELEAAAARIRASPTR